MGPPSQRLVDAACTAFALWTLAAHGVVALGGSLLDLLVAAGALAGLGAVLAGRRLARRARAGGREPAAAQEHRRAVPAAPGAAEDRRAADAAPAREGRAPRLGRAALALAGAAALFAAREDPVAAWGVSAGVLAAAAALFAGPPRGVEPAAGGRGREGILWALGLACAALALASHRDDRDDAFYANLAAAMADAPADPILRDDTLHGIAGLPIHHPAYRLHSFEALAGALAFATGIPAIAVSHLALAALGALLVPLAQARLFRLLTPRTWPWSVFALLVVFVAAGDAHRSWGNYALVRMWQGKSYLLCIFLPLVQAYALEFGLAPSRRSWLRLAAAQVAALGASATALWAAPLAASSALVCALAPSRRGLRLFALGALSSLYLVGAGLWLRRELAADAAAAPPARDEELERARDAHAPGVQLGRSLELVLGDGRLRSAALAASVLGWAALGPGLARRYAILVPALAALWLAPHASRFVAENATGPSYWRALWVVPAPTLLALVLTSPLQLAGRLRRLGQAACLGLVAAFALGVPARSSLSPRNGVRIGWPGLKVPPAEYRWAEILTRSVPPGSRVVAPLAVSTWIPVFQRRAFPLVVQGVYLRRYRREIDEEDRVLRYTATLVAGGQRPREDAERLFAEALDRYGVRGVLLRHSPGVEASQAVLAEAGFRRLGRHGQLELWVRP
jgi:hypothetical protein